jgi:hypothetical protein
MATVTGFTSAKMQAILDGTIESATINDMGNLIFTRTDGTTFDAGNFGFAAEIITVATDFNTLTVPGTYVYTLNTVVAASANLPTASLYGFASGQAGFLMVEGNGDTFIKQSWTNYNNPSENVQRISYNGVWGSWGPMAELATTSQSGLIELATTTEAAAETDTSRAVTPQGLNNQRAFRLLQSVVFTASGTFTKASYTGLKAVRVRAVGGGGAGGGVALAQTNNHSCGAGGGGGGYAESFILAAALATSETVTVGAGGTSGSGGTTSFGTKASANGGGVGGTISNQPLMVAAVGGNGGVATIGDIKGAGSPGVKGTGYATLGHGGEGGSSIYGGGGVGTYAGGGAAVTPGNDAAGYGGGGGGAAANSGSTGGAAGGAGTGGIVIVEVYV